ncbi:zinc finger protein 595-like [Gigantopelta aegis]|uniref:zinc finger protein 595-like n=1 Tax=Gigantopelta aegis TaxID=1735272 RepID=UPI001B8898D6|nr:zinc finger protein 595-like [Gigantopelta aegis]
MTHIFSNVVADISDDLKDRFPSGFDFHSMVNKVCKDADVKIHFNDTAGYKLQGFWLSIEHAYSLLATALLEYGKNEKHYLDQNDRCDTNKKQIKKFVEVVEDTRDNKGERSTEFTKVLACNKSDDLSETPQNDTAENEGKRKLRPKRKQTTQPIFHSDSDTEDEPACIDASNSASFDNVASEKQTDEKINTKKCRGRPRKYPPGFVKSKIYHKYRTKLIGYVKKKNKENTIHTSQKRKRGRPRKTEDDVEGDFPCQDCDLVAKSRNALGDHRHRVHLSCPTKCDICCKVFPNFRYMKRHRASHVEPQHCCDICGKMYKIKKAMLDHKKTHDKNYVRPSFDCHLCSKNFCNRYILDCHIKAEHLGQKKSYLCSVCGKSFTTRHSLAEHSNAHTGAKPHVCEMCGKGFTYESALRDHKFTHANNKQFVCHLCNKSFNQRSGLKMHLRIHADVKKFVCSECGRSFTQKQALQRHFRVHKGEKPFICKLCSRSFTDASIIRRHLILVHKINKDAKSWREDIICQVKAALNYHVEKISQNVDENETQTQEANSSDDAKQIAEKQPEPSSEKANEADLHQPPSLDTQPSVKFYEYQTQNEHLESFDSDRHSTDHPRLENSENQHVSQDAHFLDARKHWFDNSEKPLEHGSQPRVISDRQSTCTVQSDGNSDGQNHLYHASQGRGHTHDQQPEGFNFKSESPNPDVYAHRPLQRDSRYSGIPHSQNVAGNRTDQASSGSGSQAWPMYAYYSHLASQFGMNLNDYTYINSHGNPHQ